MEAASSAPPAPFVIKLAASGPVRALCLHSKGPPGPFTKLTVVVSVGSGRNAGKGDLLQFKEMPFSTEWLQRVLESNEKPGFCSYISRNFS